MVMLSGAALLVNMTKFSAVVALLPILVFLRFSLGCEGTVMTPYVTSFLTVFTPRISPKIGFCKTPSVAPAAGVGAWFVLAWWLIFLDA